MTTPVAVRAAYARKLSRISCDLEKLARLGRAWLEPGCLGGLWEQARATHNLAAWLEPTAEERKAAGLDDPPDPSVFDWNNLGDPS